jgi:hypothetical protein
MTYRINELELWLCRKAGRFAVFRSEDDRSLRRVVVELFDDHLVSTAAAPRLERAASLAVALVGWTHVGSQEPDPGVRYEVLLDWNGSFSVGVATWSTGTPGVPGIWNGELARPGRIIAFRRPGAPNDDRADPCNGVVGVVMALRRPPGVEDV